MLTSVNVRLEDLITVSEGFRLGAHGLYFSSVDPVPRPLPGMFAMQFRLEQIAQLESSVQ